MKRRDLLKQAVAFAALASLRAPQAGAAETNHPVESLLGEKTAPPWLELGPAPAENCCRSNARGESLPVFVVKPKCPACGSCTSSAAA